MKALFWTFFFVGFVAVIIAVYFGADSYLFVNGARQASGIVDKLEERGRTGEQGQYVLEAPRISFTVADGSIIRFTSGSSSYPPAFKEGDRVAVLYRPEQPYDARIDSFMDLYFTSAVAASIGIVFILGALLVRRFDRKGWGLYSRTRR